MDKNALDYICYAKELGHSPNILTNGQLLTRDLIDKLLGAGCREFSISVDAINADDYAKIRRGGDFNKVLDALSFLKQKKVEYPDITTEVCNVLLSEYNENTIHEYCRFWNGKTDLVYWQAMVDDNFDLQNTIYEKPNEKDRCDCALGIFLLPSGHIYPCCALGFCITLGKIDWLPHIDSFTPAEAWEYFNESYKKEGSPFWKVCKNCNLWPIYYCDKMGNSLNNLQIKLENAAPLPRSILYKKGPDGLQYNRGDKPHAATPFFTSPLAENGQELFITMQFETPCDFFTLVVQNAHYDQLAIKTVKDSSNAEICLAISVYVCCEELRLVFYPASGVIDDFVPASLEIATNAVSREFLRYSKLKTEAENKKVNTIFHKDKRFLKGFL